MWRKDWLPCEPFGEDRVALKMGIAGRFKDWDRCFILQFSIVPLTLDGVGFNVKSILEVRLAAVLQRVLL